MTLCRTASTATSPTTPTSVPNVDFSLLPTARYLQARQPSNNGGGSFSSDFGPFRGLKIGVLMGCLWETSIFKIIIIDRVTLWPKLEYTW